MVFDFIDKDSKKISKHSSIQTQVSMIQIVVFFKEQSMDGD